MEDPRTMSDAQLKQARDLGAATYLSAYVHLMARELGVDDSDFIAVNSMAVPMITPINHATEACWRSIMRDQTGMADAMERFRRAVEQLQKGGG